MSTESVISPMLNAMSVDVEDHFQTEIMSRLIPRSSWKDHPSRVERNTRHLFDLFEKHSVLGTFFFLGWVAELYPQLVKEAVKLGHEVACHSYWHRQVYTVSPEEFRDDTKRAKECIEDAAGARVIGYRAPSFSMIPGTEWATEILAELGFLYDSSVHPIAHDFYDNRNAPREPYRRSGILEIPVSTVRIGGRNYPFSGGGYFRLLPYQITRLAIRHLNRKEAKPGVFYIHPWEVDDHPPRLADHWKSNLRQYIRTGDTNRALSRLLQDFRFAPMAEVFHVKSWTEAVSPVSKNCFVTQNQ